jgi:crotonobetainyl-CoA:carnitine CoA-transferase CaiB-like acyl-CoA transferase
MQRSANHLLSLLNRLGLANPPDGEVEIIGRDPVLPCRFPVSEIAASVLAAIGMAVNDLWELRTGRRQQLRVDIRHTAASLRGAHLQVLNGKVVERPPTPDILFSNFYQCFDGRWIHLHGSFPHLAAKTAKLLGCERERAAISAVVAGWNSINLEDSLAEIGVCGAIARSAAEWAVHPQGIALSSVPPVEVIKIAESAPEPLLPGKRPLTRTRVLDLTRVLAGPIASRVLAEHGADVMTVSSPNLPTIVPFVMETNHGKLSTYLNLDDPIEFQQLRRLILQSDVFIHGYRTGSLEQRGLSPDELAMWRPGLIYVSINCYGSVGPWKSRRGWEQLGQTVTGLAVAQGAPDPPQIMPAQVCDYTTGYLAALGILIALARRVREGGTYHVRASLSQTGMWIERAGAICDTNKATGFGDVDDLRITTESPFGNLHHLRPVLDMSETPPFWSRPSGPLGTHPPIWPE